MTTLGKQLVVFADIGICDTKYEHAMRIVTDGRLAYVYGDLHDTDLVSRHAEIIEATCGARLPHDDPCEGRLTFDLSTDRWTADPTYLDTLSSYGSPIDQE